MKILRIRLRPMHLVITLFFGVLMAGNPIATSYGLVPAKDLVRSIRAGSQRRIRNINLFSTWKN